MPSTLVSESLGTVMRLGVVPLSDVVELSRHLHVRVVELGVERAQAGDLERLSELSRVEPASDAATNADHAAAFLSGLARAAHEPLLEVLVGTLDALVIELTSLSIGYGAELLPELRAIRGAWAPIADALVDRDADRARAAVHAYFDGVEHIISAHAELRTARMSDDLWASALDALALGQRRSASRSSSPSSSSA